MYFYKSAANQKMMIAWAMFQIVLVCEYSLHSVKIIKQSKSDVM